MQQCTQCSLREEGSISLVDSECKFWRFLKVLCCAYRLISSSQLRPSACINKDLQFMAI